nr:uncharacterized protein LOC118878259 [Drosophila suzukii]
MGDIELELERRRLCQRSVEVERCNVGHDAGCDCAGGVSARTLIKLAFASCHGIRRHLENIPIIPNSKTDFYIRSDLEFVDSLLKDFRLEALVYNLFRGKLVENLSSESVEDLEKTHLERIDEMRRRPRQQALMILVPLLPGSQPEV